MITKAIIALATQNPWAAFALNTAVDGIISGELDLDNILKNAAFTAITAGLGEFAQPGDFTGVTDHLTSGLNLSTAGLAGSQYFSPQWLATSAIDAGTTGLAETALYGGSLGDNIAGNFKGAVINEAGAALFNEVGNVKQSNKWGEGSVPGALLHGATGCLSFVAQGGKCGAGFVISAANEFASPYYDDGFVENPNATAVEQEQARKTYELKQAYKLGVITGTLTSGGDASNIGRGSGLATSATANNRQLHIEEVETIKRYADEYAVQQGYCATAASCSKAELARAEAELAAETSRGVSDDFAHVVLDTSARAFLNGLNIAGDAVDDQILFGELDRASDEYKNSTINMVNFNDPEVISLYSSLPRVLIAADGSSLDAAVYAMHGLTLSQGGGTDLYNYANSYSAYDLNKLLAAQNAYLGVLEQVRETSDSFDLARDYNVLAGVDGDSFAFGKEGLRSGDSAPFLDPDYFGKDQENYLYLHNAKDAITLLDLGAIAAVGAFTNVNAGLAAQR